MVIDKDLEIAKLLFEAVQVMVPLLTAFLTIYAGGVAKTWEKTGGKLLRSDVLWISTICFFSVFALGCWALTLAGAIISTSGGAGLTVPVSNDNALVMARISMGVGYWLFIGVLASAGIYFYRITKQLREANKAN